MNVKEFGSKFKLLTKRDEEGADIIRGKAGHIFQFSNTQLGVMFLCKSAKTWGNRRRICEDARMTLIQSGDCEGCLIFDPTDASQARAAIRAVEARRKKDLSPEQRAAMAERMKNVRRITQAG
jgi:hypothetical protein